MKKTFENIYLVGVFLFLFLPIAVLILFSFNTSRLNIVFEGFTLHWYQDLLQNRTLLESLGNTLIVAGISTVVSTVIGTISAYGLHKYNFKGKSLVNELLYIPVVIPEIVLGIALLSVYTLLRLELGLFTLILAHICFCIPFVIISVRSVLDGMDSHIEEVASDLGASRFQTFIKIMIPMLMPGILSGAQRSLTLSLDDVVISYFTAGPGANTLPLQVYSMIKTGITPDVNALITIMLGIVFILLTISTIVQLRRLKKEVTV